MRKIKYTIYTENTPQLRPLLDEYLSGYTIHIGEGRWNGVAEQAATITYIYISEVANAMIHSLIRRILVDCKQDSVYLETEEIELREFTKTENRPSETIELGEFRWCIPHNRLDFCYRET